MIAISRCALRWMATAGLAMLPSGITSAAEQWNFEYIFSRAAELYRLDSRANARLVAWQQLIESQRSKPLPAQLDAVNHFFNRQLRFEDDQWIWGEADYWATPIESLIKGAADCEDYAIAKYLSLKQLGVAAEQLRLAYVKSIDLDRAHMVLVWYADPSAEPLVLDNLTDEILPASQRPDLLPVYSFNASGLWLAGGGNRQVGSSQRLPRWQDLQNKLMLEGFPAAEPNERGD